MDPTAGTISRTARPDNSYPQTMQMIEAVVECENMIAALRRGLDEVRAWKSATNGSRPMVEFRGLTHACMFSKELL